MQELAATNNEIIKHWSEPYQVKLQAEKVRLGIHHNRTRAPRKATVKFKYEGGEIKVIGVVMTKGDVMTHKGKGGRGQDKRVEKPWFNPVTEVEVDELANDLAENTGDVICGNILIR